MEKVKILIYNIIIHQDKCYSIIAPINNQKNLTYKESKSNEILLTTSTNYGYNQILILIVDIE